MEKGNGLQPKRIRPEASESGGHGHEQIPGGIGELVRQCGILQQAERTGRFEALLRLEREKARRQRQQADRGSGGEDSGRKWLSHSDGRGVDAWLRGRREDEVPLWRQGRG